MGRIRQSFVATYLSLDPRSLGLFRISYGCVLLLSLYFRVQAVDWYTNVGIFPGHALLWRPAAGSVFSLFFALSSRTEVLTGMALCGLVFLLFTLGYRTRIFQFLSLLCLVSLNGRLSLLECGGDVVLNLLGVWTLVLPLGRRFSIDSVLLDLREQPETHPGQLGAASNSQATTAAVVSLAALALILQFFLIYYFNVAHKTGPSWHDGSAVHLTLHQDRIVTALGVWLRENAPYSGLRALSYATLVVEGLGAALIISPLFTGWTRGLAVLLLPALHLGFALCLRLGPFSYAMACFFPLLLGPTHWRWLYHWLRRRTTARTVYYDGACGFCFQCARLLRRLDLLQRLDLRASDDPRLPAGQRAEADHTLVVIDAAGRAHTRSSALAETLRALPLGWLPAMLLRLPGLRQLVDAAYDLLAARRTSVSQWLGLTACGTGVHHSAAPAPSPPSPVRLGARRLGRLLGEAFVTLMLVASFGEVARANPAMPRWTRYPQPAFLHSLVVYPRLLQGWRMFAPEAPREDFMISVEATTAEGRLVDPYNEVASRQRTPPFRAIPSGLDNDQFFTTHALFAPRPDWRVYRSALQQWILRYPERTGRHQDRIVKFTVYKLKDRSPEPGQLQPTHFTREPFMGWPARKEGP